ncbi:MAG: hypothetical protein GTO03_02450, partial [Planctomycetales bacterium]|nr:hypothetical protein [Planctomycetales bacterium]
MRPTIPAICGCLVLVTVATSGCGSQEGGGQRSLSQQLEDARGIDDPVERTNALIRVANNYVKAADTLGARESLQHAAKAAGEIDAEIQGEDRVRAHIKLAEACRTAGDRSACEDAYEAAEDGLDDLENATAKTELLIDLALLKVKLKENDDAASDLKSAEKAAPDIEDSFLRVELLAWVAYGYKQLDQADEAARVMNEAKSQAEDEAEDGNKARLLSLVGREQISSLEDQQAGLETLEQAAGIARSISDNAFVQAS